MAKAKIEKTNKSVFVVVDGVRVARRGYPDSQQAGTWVSIEPGWEALDSAEGILIRHNGVWVH
jgi:hypothetical protein